MSETCGSRREIQYWAWKISEMEKRGYKERKSKYERGREISGTLSDRLGRVL